MATGKLAVNSFQPIKLCIKGLRGSWVKVDDTVPPTTSKLGRNATPSGHATRKVTSRAFIINFGYYNFVYCYYCSGWRAIAAE